MPVPAYVYLFLVILRRRQYYTISGVYIAGERHRQGNEQIVGLRLFPIIGNDIFLSQNLCQIDLTGSRVTLVALLWAVRRLGEVLLQDLAACSRKSLSKKSSGDFYGEFSGTFWDKDD